MEEAGRVVWSELDWSQLKPVSDEQILQDIETAAKSEGIILK